MSELRVRVLTRLARVVALLSDQIFSASGHVDALAGALLVQAERSRWPELRPGVELLDASGCRWVIHDWDMVTGRKAELLVVQPGGRVRQHLPPTRAADWWRNAHPAPAP